MKDKNYTKEELFDYLRVKQEKILNKRGIIFSRKAKEFELIDLILKTNPEVRNMSKKKTSSKKQKKKEEVKEEIKEEEPVTTIEDELEIEPVPEEEQVVLPEDPTLKKCERCGAVMVEISKVKNETKYQCPECKWGITKM